MMISFLTPYLDKTISKWLIGLLVLLLVYFLINPSDVPQKVNEEPFRLNAEEIADYFVQGLQLEYYDTAGRLDYRIEADRLLHFQEKYLSLLMEPRFFWFDNTGIKNRSAESISSGHWAIRSKTAEWLHNKHLLQFKQQVQLNNLLYPALNSALEIDNKNRTSLLLNTEYLDVFLDQDLVLTDAPVNAKSGNLIKGEVQPLYQINAQGMELNLADDSIKFLHNVRTHYFGDMLSTKPD